MRAEVGQHRVEHLLLQATGDQARAELGKDRGVEARIGQLERQTVLPVDTGADSIGGLPVGEAFDVLHHRHKREAPRRLHRATTHREERRKLLVGEQRADLVAHAHEGAATPESRAGNADGICGDGIDGVRVQRHGGPPSSKRASKRASESVWLHPTREEDKAEHTATDEHHRRDTTPVTLVFAKTSVTGQRPRIVLSPR